MSSMSDVPAPSGRDEQCGDDIFVDLAPAKGGQRGQVIDFRHETGATNVLATSFGEWIGKFADDLESGKFRFDDRSHPRIGVLMKIRK